MERSRPGSASPLLVLAAIAGMDAVARLAAPVSLLALSAGDNRAALLSALVVGVLGVLRGVFAGFAAQRVEGRIWRRLVSAVRASDVVELRARSDEEQTWRLVDAAHRHVDLAAHVRPRLVADAVALVATAVAVVVWLGVGWLLLGMLAIGGLAAVVTPGQRAIRRLEQGAWGHLTELGADLDVLLEGAAELRVHGHEARLSSALLVHADRAAALRRRSQTLSALVGLLPLALVLVVLSLSSQLGPETAGLTQDTLATGGVLGGAGFVYALGFARGLEAYAHAAPQRRLLASYLARDPDEAKSSPRVDPEVIHIDDVSVAYSGASLATPKSVRHRWHRSHSIALVGANGAGKTTLAQTVLGLLHPSEGMLRFDGQAADDATLAGFRRGAVYLPQAPYLAPERTVEWHLRLVAPSGVTEAHLREALSRVDLLETLEMHDNGPLGALAGELSGGERRRLFLARLFISRPETPTVVVLDEPEAGLDGEARAWLRSVLEELATEGRVLLIAHDPGVVPEAFERISCSAG